MFFICVMKGCLVVQAIVTKVIICSDIFSSHGNNSNRSTSKLFHRLRISSHKTNWYICLQCGYSFVFKKLIAYFSLDFNIAMKLTGVIRSRTFIFFTALLRKKYDFIAHKHFNYL